MVTAYTASLAALPVVVASASAVEGQQAAATDGAAWRDVLRIAARIGRKVVAMTSHNLKFIDPEDERHASTAVGRGCRTESRRYGASSTAHRIIG